MSRPLPVVLLVCCWLFACASPPPPPQPDPVPVEDKLDGRLGVLLQSYETAGIAGLSKRLKAMEADGIVHDGHLVKVDITATSAAVIPELQTALLNAGGRIETSFDNTLFGWLPIPALRNYTSKPEVWTIKISVPRSSPAVSSTGPASDGTTLQGVSNVRPQKHR